MRGYQRRQKLFLSSDVKILHDWFKTHEVIYISDYKEAKGSKNDAKFSRDDFPILLQTLGMEKCGGKEGQMPEIGCIYVLYSVDCICILYSVDT